MKTSYFIPQQVPQHILAEYPAFVEFITAYYEWFDQQSIGSLYDLLDVDNTVESFVQYFKKELDETGVLANIDNRLYLKNIKQLYRAKGSKASFQFFFRLLYNQESEIEHPWDYTFIPSAGKWKQDTAIIIRITKGNGDLLGGNYITIIDSNGKQYNTYVHDVVQRATNVFELFIDRFACSAVRMAFVTSLDNSIQGEIVLSTAKAFVEEPGEGFKIGQIFRINSLGGLGTVVKIKDVDDVGGIKSVEIIAFGYGYRADFNTSLIPIQDVRLDYNLNLTRRDNNDDITGLFNYQTNDQPGVGEEAGEIVRHDYTPLTGNKAGSNTDFFEDGTYVGDLLGGFDVEDKTVSEKRLASVRFKVGCIFHYPGYYADSTNLLDNLIYIHDSYYYQIYSYVTVVENSITKYGDTLKKILHPTGTIHFGRVKISNVFDLTISSYPSLNLLVNPDIWQDYIEANQYEITFGTNKNTITEAPVTDQLSYVANYTRYMNEDLNTDPNEYIVSTQSSLSKTFTPDIFRNNVITNDLGTVTDATVDDEGNVIAIRILDDVGNLIFGIFPGMELVSYVDNVSNLTFEINSNWLTSDVTSSSTFNYSWLIKNIYADSDIVSSTDLDQVQLTPAIVLDYFTTSSDRVELTAGKDFITDTVQIRDTSFPTFEPIKEPSDLVTTSNSVNIYKDPVYVNTNETWTVVGYLENEFYTTY